MKFEKKVFQHPRQDEKSVSAPSMYIMYAYKVINLCRSDIPWKIE